MTSSVSGLDELLNQRTYLGEDDIRDSVRLGREGLAKVLVPCDKILPFDDKWRV